MSSDINSVELSVIVPVYNEELNIDYLFERLLSVLETLDTSYEIVCVNDGSKDNTLKCLIEHHHRNPVIKVVNLSRNFGKEVALSAGLDYATGAAVVPIDADLQDPPELIKELVEKWREGYDVVYATRRSRGEESWLKQMTANAFYKIIGKMSRVPIPRNTGDFRLLDRRVVEAIKQMPERTRFMKGLFAWVGFKQTSVLFDRPQRYKGTTTWNYWRLWNFAIDGITSFSFLPLKVWSYVGVTISLLSFLYATFLIYRTLLYGVDLPGYASIMVAILFLGGIQLVTLGIIGEYLSRVYEEVKGRPLYLVRDAYGFKNNGEEGIGNRD
ncbi:glycosyltransferase family 2 protein [Funiculus sociatus GB2-A5]|uniref:Glycosyltransferase family 2 protein n=1 Tax=Funiculus sociatus GB2-A5 TaxID=2933946 RepID=A0ABV0JN48_9CYAN|nr:MULTISPECIES: glycosyltransferase family 2 protein [unclassified Trichocoleus]MBD1906355.1 glycosyltransferase family 2 protein [Trichocoleus sp. FACHB-832]MBD2064910.1 glycosyltransferase family 2 protein [Trichocoleus sp. FACHB-6]